MHTRALPCPMLRVRVSAASHTRQRRCVAQQVNHLTLARTLTACSACESALQPAQRQLQHAACHDHTNARRHRLRHSTLNRRVDRVISARPPRATTHLSRQSAQRALPAPTALPYSREPRATRAPSRPPADACYAAREPRQRPSGTRRPRSARSPHAHARGLTDARHLHTQRRCVRCPMRAAALARGAHELLDAPDPPHAQARTRSARTRTHRAHVG